MLKVIKIFIDRTCVYMEQEKRFIFVRYFNIMHFVNVMIFRWSNFSDFNFSVIFPFSGVALLNWFTRSSKFEEGFNNNKLSWSFFRSFHCVMLLLLLVQQARKFLLLDKVLKGKIVLQHSMQYQDWSQFWRYQ